MISSLNKFCLFLVRFIRQASSGTRADHPQSRSAVSVPNFHPQPLWNIIYSYNSKRVKSKPALHGRLSYIQKKVLLLVCLIVALFDYYSDLNYKGCIVKDEGEMEQIKKRFIVRDKIYQKEYENKYKSSQKRVKVPKKVPKPSHTFIKMKRITFFSHKKRKPSQKQSPKIFYKKAVLPNKSLQKSS